MQSLTPFLTDVLPHVLVQVQSVVQAAADQKPEDEDVKAGWTAFAIFLLLIAAVAFLGWSLTKQLRKARAARDAGVYGDLPGDDDSLPDQAGVTRP